MSEDTLFESLAGAVPTPRRQSEHRAAFLAQAAALHAESKIEAVRHNGVSGGAAARIGNDQTKGIDMTTLRPRRIAYGLRLTAVAIVGFAIAFAVSPDLRTLAQQVIQYFSRTADVAPAQVTIGGGHEPAVRGPQPESFAAALSQASFDARVPSAMPPAYQPFRAEYVAEAQGLTLDYRCGQMWGLMLVQVPQTGEPGTRLDIGESAAVVDVTIDGQPGQYVQGTWVYDTPSETGPDGPLRTVETIRRWENDVEFHRLFWSQDGIDYMLSTSSGSVSGETPMGACALDQSILVAIAESVR